MTTPNIHCVRLFWLTEEGAQYLDNPPLAKVLDALAAMDGDESDTLSVTLSNGDSMDVGGGANGLYKCMARTLGSFFDLLNPDVQKDVSDTVEIQMNDEVNSFPRCTLVSIEPVEEAISCFCTTGELSSKLLWDSALEYDPL